MIGRDPNSEYFQTMVRQEVACLLEDHVDIEIIWEPIGIRLGRSTQPFETWQCAYWFCAALDSARYYFKEHLEQLYQNPQPKAGEIKPC